MKKIHTLILIGSTILLASCLRLDSQMFNEKEITSYELDAYTGDREIKDLPASYSADPDKTHLFTLESNDDGSKETIYAIYLGEIDSITTDTVILYCHGNKWHMDYYWNRQKLLANVGGHHRFGVMMMDYRGFGLSSGSSTESSLNADVQACLDWLTSKGLTQDRLIMYGFSLGSAPATELTAYPRSLKPQKLILEAPFASTEVMVQDGSALALPASFFTNVDVNNQEKIRDVHQPFCWLHGINDDFLSIETHGEVVFAHHPGPDKTAYRVEGAHHNDLPKMMGYSVYSQAILEFILHNE